VLYIVPTPIGNLKDITYRAVEILGSADFVLCEDTRRTKKLLNHFAVTTTVKRYNEHSEKSVNLVLQLLKSGKKIALVSDGGTPVISDPGHKLVSLARKEGIAVVSLAGASALTCAMAGSGFGGGGFVFLGFLPRSQTKITNILTDAFKFKKPVVLYESPHRIIKLLNTVTQNFSADMPAVLARELTKLHEEWITGSVSEICTKLSLRQKILGEIVLILNPLITSLLIKED
jgi:16S rRNA (cytidine1402-2'-O)-methyltransferase